MTGPKYIQKYEARFPVGVFYNVYCGVPQTITAEFIEGTGLDGARFLMDRDTVARGFLCVARCRVHVGRSYTSWSKTPCMPAAYDSVLYETTSGNVSYVVRSGSQVLVEELMMVSITPIGLQYAMPSPELRKMAHRLRSSGIATGQELEVRTALRRLLRRTMTVVQFVRAMTIMLPHIRLDVAMVTGMVNGVLL